MKRQTIVELILVAIILTFGIASRFWLIDYPNFKPIAAFALMGGFLFRSWIVALLAISVTMFASNVALGSCEWQISLAVYASLAFAVGLGTVLQSVLGKGNSSGEVAKRMGGFALGALVMSTVFFLLTNLATWYCWYPTTLSGLQDCFVMAIPFFRWTLAGDLTFTMGMVVVLQAVYLWLPERQSRLVAADV